MTNAWETTEDDLKQVLDAHEVKLEDWELKQLFGKLMLDEIEHGVLNYADMDSQTDSMLDDIENQLLLLGVVHEPKQFYSPGVSPESQVEE